MSTLDDRLMAALAISLDAEIVSRRQLGGGDVAESFRVDLDDGRRLFAKTHRSPPPGFFSTEAAGLEWLRAAGTVAVPEVVACEDGEDGEDGGPPFLVLEWITAGRARAGTEAELGRALADLHRSGAPSFGREDRRSTGSRGLPNEPCGTWLEFYATQRLLPLVRLAGDAGALPATDLRRLESVADRLGALGGPPEPPARLHGDLWGGNRLVDDTGTSWLIDPAAHGGHREFDLAMMRLFGGFGAACYAAYAETYPLGDGWEDRIPLHQLAPLVVHAVKFGGGYAGAVGDALTRLR